MSANGVVLQPSIEALAAPIAGPHPAGPNIRTDAAYQNLYFRLKDARNEARTAERSSASEETMRLSPHWNDVNRMAVDALLNVTKDIEILAWLAEAQIRLGGFQGLGDVFVLMGRLFDQCWDDIHSIGDEPEDRIAPIVGLNGVSGEGALIQPIRLAPLVPNTAFFTLSLWDFQVAQRNGKDLGRFDEAVREAGPQAMRSHLATVTRCLEAFEALNDVLAEKLNDDAPPSSNTRNVLREAGSAIRALTGIGEPAANVTSLADFKAEVPSVSRAEETPPASNGAIASREEAFEILLSVARYFRQAEPHSPLSYSIETMVRRGRMNFVDLLKELLPEQQARRALLVAAGINSEAESQS